MRRTLFLVLVPFFSACIGSTNSSNDPTAGLLGLIGFASGPAAESASSPEAETGGELPLPEGSPAEYTMQINDERRPASEAFAFETIQTIDLDFTLQEEGGAASGHLVQIREQGAGNAFVYQSVTDTNGKVSGNFTTATAVQSVSLQFEHNGKVYSSTVDANRLAAINRTADMRNAATTSEPLPDSDSDGVPDAADDFPYDSERATALHFPQSGLYTIAFEDLYPRKGDADFNDFVVQFRQTEELNAAGQVVRIEGRYRHVAKAAGYNHRLRLNLPTGPAEFRRVQYPRDGASPIETLRNLPDIQGVEIIPKSNTTITNSNAHPGQTFAPGDFFLIEITPEEPLAKTALGEPPYDLYLEVLNTKQEVHFAGRQPAGQTDPYLDSDGFPWALLTPVDWRWMYERKDIRSAYPDFQTWYESDGEEARDWYLRPDPELVFPAATSFIAPQPSFAPPAGFAPEDFTVRKSMQSAPYRIQGFAPVSAVVDIEPVAGGSFQFPGEPAAITFHYDQSALQNAGLIEDFAVFYFDEGDQTWKAVDRVEADTETQTVRAYTSHLTPFVLTALPTPAGGQQPEPPSCIEADFPLGLQGSGNAEFSTIDLDFRYYQDRNYYIRPVSESANNTAVFQTYGFEGALGISTCNGGSPCGPQSAHKLYAGDDYITFTAHVDLDVYVMYDDRGAGAEADWLRDGTWTDTGAVVETTDPGADYLVFQKSFNAGDPIALHGNRRGASAAVQTNYWALIKPAGDTSASGAAALCETEPDTTPPALVTNLQAAPGGGTVTLTWQNPANADFAGVVIRRGNTAPPAKINEGVAATGTTLNPQSFRDESVAAGNTYYYTIFALDENNLYQQPGVSVAVTTGLDSDGDGLTNAYENATNYATVFPGSPAPNFSCPRAIDCPAVPDPADTDSDGTSDGVEVANGTDPTNPDTTRPVIGTFALASATPSPSAAIDVTLAASDDTAITG